MDEWSVKQDEIGLSDQAAMPSKGFQAQQSGLTEGIGSVEDSTKLLPEIKESVKQFFGLLKGPIMKALLALTAVQLLVALCGIFARMVLGIAGIDGFLLSAVNGLEWLVGSLVVLAIVVFQVALFRPANDQVTGFVQGPPDSMKAALKVSSPAFVPVLLACLMSGGVAGLGTMFCLVPGVIAFIALFPMRYLSATRPDFTEYRFTQVLESSLMVGKKYWAAMLGLGGALFGVAVVGAGGSAIVSSIALAINLAVINSMGSGGAVAVVSAVILAGAQIISWLFTALMVMGIWVLEGGVLSVLARHEDLVRQSGGQSIGEGA